uniref:RRM domain-containing protein n=1 Tax=Gongylonema pulchrum TaxID=637853 RepID=A0A183EKH3_9BILA
LAAFSEKLQSTTGYACLIRFDNKEAAQRAFASAEENGAYKVEPRLGRRLLGKAYRTRPCALRLLIKWWRRPSLCIGQIKCFDEQLKFQLKTNDPERRVDAFHVLSEHFSSFTPSMASSHYTNRDASAENDELSKITLRSLPMDMQGHQLRAMIEPVLRSYNIEFDEIYVIRKKAYPIESELYVTSRLVIFFF